MTPPWWINTAYTYWLAAVLLLPPAAACAFVDLTVIPFLMVYGTVVSVLLFIVMECQERALRRWCDRHGIEWRKP